MERTLEENDIIDETDEFERFFILVIMMLIQILI